jgi:signal transduction histidine kinase
VAAPVDNPITPLDEPIRSLLAGLATVHPLVIAIDGALGGPRRVRWICDELGLFRGESDDLLHRPIATLIEALRGSQDKALPLRSIDQLDDAFSGEESLSHELIQTGIGDLPIEINTFAALDPAGAPLRVLLGDRSPKPATYEARRALEKKNEELETCLHSVSHDLRSPLVSVLGFTRLLRDEFGEPIGRTGLHFLDRIEQAGRNMERLLHDMLELSRIEDTPNCPVRVSPIPVLEQLAAELRLQLDEAGIELRLPQRAPTLTFDRTRLYQLFSNLIGNAIRHMDRDTKGLIEVEIETVSDGYQISVRDNGPGIEPADRERIFQAFQTIDRPTGAADASKPKSSGLGLAIVNKIVATHRGRVWIESERGHGARFLVWLPQH